MAVLDTMKEYVNVVNKKLTYIETTNTDYVFQLENYKLPKPIIDKNMRKVLKERTPNILLDINQQNIGMYDYIAENYGNGIRFKLPKTNFPYTITPSDEVQVTGTFGK
jgi:hypothetical protein